MCWLLKYVCLLMAAIAFCTPVLAGNVVTVPCPPGIVDSSQAITNALLSIRPGGTVRLVECTYYLSDPVVVTGSFNGALKGAGMNKTVLTTLVDDDGIEDVLMLNWISDLDNPGTLGPTLGPTLFHFSFFGDEPSRIAMSGLTIDIADEHPAFASARAGWFDGALLAIITVEGLKVSTAFDQIELIGRRGSFGFGSNVCYGIEVWGELSFWPYPGTNRPMVGDHVLRRSVIKDIVTGYNFGMMTNSRMMVIGNRILNPIYDAIDGGDMISSTLHVTQNHIELAESWWGIWLNATDGTLVNQNRITGELAAGGAGINAVTGSRDMILNNDLNDLTVPPGSYLVWLGAGTSDSLVVGVDPALVLDEGTNNRIIPGGRGH